MSRQQFHTHESTLIALAVGGLIASAKELVAVVVYLYRFALTPQGSAAFSVGSFLILATILAVTLLRR